MFRILNKQILSDGVKRLDIYAPRIAAKVKAGQFIGICPEEGSERIPLTVVDSNMLKGSISLIFQENGPTTKELGAMAINSMVFSILGPLGVPSKLPEKNTVVCIATGIGLAQCLPIARALKDNGNKVIGIMGARTKKDLMLESQWRIACTKLFMATQDGSYEKKALATDILKDLLAKENVDCVYAFGSIEMMQVASAIAKQKKIRSRVTLSPVMVDCMGMCGSCRVKVDNKVVLACVDGPEFDGQKVDYGELRIRMNAYHEGEKWDQQKSQLSPKKNGARTLTKFLSDILNG